MFVSFNFTDSYLHHFSRNISHLLGGASQIAGDFQIAAAAEKGQQTARSFLAIAFPYSPNGPASLS